MGIRGWGSTKTTPCSSHSPVRSLWLIQTLPTHCQKGLPFFPLPHEDATRPVPLLPPLQLCQHGPTAEQPPHAGLGLRALWGRSFVQTPAWDSSANLLVLNLCCFAA